MEVTLTATPAPDSYFIGWTGDCLASGSNPTCTLIVDSYKWVGADFALKPLVTVGITGNGTVTSDPPNIDCVGPGTCSSYFNPGTDVSLIEDPDSYWEFSGWTGDCNGVGDCFLLDIHDDKTVNAAFESIGPTAIMYSFVDPAADDCRGPGCSWGSVATPWITYKNTQYKVVNASIFQDPASMYTFDWYFDGELLFSCEEPGGATSECHIENIAGMAVGDHTVQLKAADEYGSFDETTEKNIIIRPDTNADFKCSLDAADEEGQDCGDIAPLAGQEVYFIDNSVPSGGADEIIEWTWQKGHMDGGTFVRDETFGYTEKVSTALSSESDTIKLIVKDNHLRDDYYPAGRGDSETKSLAVQFPLPKYREVAPR